MRRGLVSGSNPRSSVFIRGKFFIPKTPFRDRLPSARFYPNPPRNERRSGGDSEDLRLGGRVRGHRGGAGNTAVLARVSAPARVLLCVVEAGGIEPVSNGKCRSYTFHAVPPQELCTSNASCRRVRTLRKKSPKKYVLFPSTLEALLTLRRVQHVCNGRSCHLTSNTWRSSGWVSARRPGQRY